MKYFGSLDVDMKFSFVVTVKIHFPIHLCSDSTDVRGKKIAFSGNRKKKNALQTDGRIYEASGKARKTQRKK